MGREAEGKAMSGVIFALRTVDRGPFVGYACDGVVAALPLRLDIAQWSEELDWGACNPSALQLAVAMLAAAGLASEHVRDLCDVFAANSVLHLPVSGFAVGFRPIRRWFTAALTGDRILPVVNDPESWWKERDA
jgi:hypothetical protein